MTYQINYAYACQTGKIRANNEDNFWCCSEQLPVENQGLEGIHNGSVLQNQLPVLAVFDGMGGESCGEMAAYLAAEAFGRYYGENKKGMKRNPEIFLKKACKNMNEAVCRYGSENRVLSMGTTMAMITFGRKAMYTCNLGDSRIYRMKEGQLSSVKRKVSSSR